MLKKEPNILLSIRKKDGSELDDIFKRRRDDRAIELITEVLNDKKDTSTKWALDEIWKDIRLLKLLSVHPIRLQFPGSMDPKVLFDLIGAGKRITEENEKKLESRILYVCDHVQRKAKDALHPSLEPIGKLLGEYSINIEIARKSDQIVLKLPKGTSRIVGEVTELKRTMGLDIANIAGMLHHYLMTIGLDIRHELLKSIDLEKKKYHGLIEKLRMNFVILPMFSLYLCQEHLESPQYAIEIGSRILPDIKCSRCGRKEKSSITGVFYSFEPRISEMISRNGGMLPCAVMWFLEKNSIPWLPDIELDGSAQPKLDILAKCNKREEYVLIEVKRREIRDKPRGIINQFQSGIKSQFVPALSSWLDKDVPLIRGYLLTNYPDNRKKPFRDACLELEKKAMSLLRTDTSSDIPADFQIKVLGLENVKHALCNTLNIES